MLYSISRISTIHGYGRHRISSPGFVEIMAFGTRKVAQNYLLRNNGHGCFTDVTAEVGVAGDRNTWTGAFIDLTGKGYPDLVVANDEGEVDIYKNNGQGKNFSKIRYAQKAPVGYWMGLASGDYNQSGRQSLFLTNVGTHTTGFSGLALRLMNRVPNFPPGYTTRHMLLENLGDYNFNIHLVGEGEKGQEGKKGEKESELFEGGDTQFGWGTIFGDLNFNGNQDLVYSTGWKFLPWNRLYLTRESAVTFTQEAGKFVATNQYPNKFYSQTPLLIDLTGNNVPELIWINHFTEPKIYQLGKGIKDLKAKIYQTHIPKTAKNANSTITVETNDNRKQTRQLILGGTGLGAGESSQFFFGLTDRVRKITQTPRHT